MRACGRGVAMATEGTLGGVMLTGLSGLMLSRLTSSFKLSSTLRKPKANRPPSARVLLSGEALAAHAADTGVLTKLMRQISVLRAISAATRTTHRRSAGTAGSSVGVWSYVSRKLVLDTLYMDFLYIYAAHPSLTRV